eukprot:tig00000792_g4183.t1
MASEASSASASVARLAELERQWAAEQEALSKQVVEEDTIDLARVQRVAAFDISFPEQEGDSCCAALVVCEAAGMNVLYEAMKSVELEVPYIPSFLGFRELPAYRALWDEMLEQRPEVRPDVVLIDANGLLHPRRCGSACQVGLALGIPTVGCAKTFFHVDGVTADRFKGVALEPGVPLPIVGDSGRTWGAALRTTAGSKNPIFVSVGHGLSLASAVELVRRCCRHRVPEPIRQADLRSRELLRRRPAPAPAPPGPSN